jgi:putative peptide zinc metalloprotease protein
MVVVGLFVAGVHWAELTESITDRILAPQNILLLWVTFPLLKVLHEFGHAFAIKALGGEVHEMGIVLLVLTPIPYVDATSSSAFRNKWERIVVSAAGMAVELFIAVVALLLWVHIEPGAFRALLYNVIFIAGVSSLFFNGNPLLRYDAYYILADLLEIPNLASRGMQYMSYLAQRYCFGVRDAEPPLSTGGERVWFVIYTVASFAYRIFIYASIILFLGGQFFVAGVVLAIWAAATMIVLPIVKSIKFLSSSPTLGKKRTRAILVSGVALVVALGFVSLVPVPLSTLAEGVIWLPENVFVRAATEGFVDRLMVTEGAVVKRGDPLVQCFDPLLPARISALESRLRELRARYDAEVLTKRVQAEITKEEMAHVKAELQRSRERDAELLIHSAAAGVFHSPMAQDLPGRFVKRGELLGYVLDRSTLTVRAVVSQSDVDFVRQRSVGVKIRLQERLPETLRAVVKRELPAATEELPSRTLGQQGGGQVPVAPQDQMGVKAFQKLFLFDLEVPDESCFYNVGGRAYVRFDHGWEPLMWRWYRSIRELFMRRFNV